MLNTDPQYIGICRWGLWEVIRSWGQSHCDRISVPVGRDTRELSLSFCYVRSQWNAGCPWTEERGSLQTPDKPVTWSGNSQLPLLWKKKKASHSIVINSANYNLSFSLPSTRSLKLWLVNFLVYKYDKISDVLAF